MQVQYPRPPIIEAVFAFEFTNPIGTESVQKAADRLKKHYVFADEETTTEITFDIKTGNSNYKQSWAGVKLSSMDRADVVLCRVSQFVCSRLAPYSTWEHLRDRAQDEWKSWKSAVGPQQLRRIGLRYVNRIDVPAAAIEAGLKTEDYLNFAPRLPEGPDVPIFGYAMQVVRPLGVDSLKVIMNSATVPSPLVGYASLVLDIDVFRDEEVPRRDDEIWSLFEKMRIQKNLIFESCITDGARELFSK
jgi:uncharacterized protein (TIGR04255 family)